MKRHYPVLVPVLALSGLLAAVAGCKATPSDLREWTPADHKHQTETEAGGSARRAPARQVAGGMADMAQAVWKNQCATCHGAAGRGDGPQSVMVQARDLTNSAWQQSVSDSYLIMVIREGKGKMPAFRFPGTTVRALVELVRAFGRPNAVRPVSGGNAAQAQPASPVPPANGQPASGQPASGPASNAMPAASAPGAVSP